MNEKQGAGASALIPIIALVAVLAAALLATVFLRSRPEPPVVPTKATPARTPEPTATATPEPDLGADAARDATPIVLPPLPDSDSLVKRLVGEIAARPEAAAMLVPDAAIERFVAAVDNVANGISPRPHLRHVAPAGPYRAVPLQGDAFEVAPDAYARYDAFVEAVTAIDPRGAARLYHQLKPLVAEAYVNLGYPRGNFDATLAKAIDHLLTTPVPEQPVRLVAGPTGYRYADPELEAMSAARKHLLRLGPDNQRKLQAHLRAFSQALGVE